VLTFCSRGFEVSVSDQEGPTASVPISGATQPADAAIAKVPSVAAPTRNLIRNVKTVIIDPGHGGLDHGVTGGGLDESELSLEIAKTLRNALANAGFSVVLTREESVNRSVVDRAKLANDHHGDLLVALHAGSSFAPNAHGIEVFYPTLGSGNADAARSETQQAAALAHPYTDRSQRFAQLVAGALSDAASAEVRGIHGARLRLHRSADMPGILLEMGVLTNPADGALLEKDSYRQSIVKGIVTAVQQFNDETGDS
jgi:N-acetylmuramoyl-L-alanine amidase